MTLYKTISYIRSPAAGPPRTALNLNFDLESRCLEEEEEEEEISSMLNIRMSRTPARTQEEEQEEDLQTDLVSLAAATR